MRLFGCLLFLTCLACDSADSPIQRADAGSADASVDAQTPDAQTPDAQAPDARLLDAAVADATVDAAQLDAAQLDAHVAEDAADTGQPDAQPDAAPPPEAWRILLVGNSYVASNRLEGLLEGLLLDDPRVESAEVVRVSRGGYRLPEHAVDADTPGSTLHGHLAGPDARWTAVVLQEQSQIPGFPAMHPAHVEMIQGGERLHALATAARARTVLMLTWGRRDGDAGNPDRFADFETMQQHLNRGYLALSTALDDAPIAPVGPAFGEVLAADPAVFRGLYVNDGSHPSLAGSYVAAAVLYRTLTGRAAADRGWQPDGLEDAMQLRVWADMARVPE